MEVVPIFSDFLALENYSDKIDLMKLETEIYHYANNDPDGNVISNVGGYQSDVLNFQLILENYPEFKKLLDLIVQDVNKVVNKDDYLSISGAWININKSGDYNTHHVHPFSVISGSFYVNIPKNTKDGEAQIGFRRSREFDDYNMSDHLNNMDGMFRWSSMWIKPKNSDLVMFPSYVSHDVSPHFSDEDRISIAFNTRVKNDS